jgi:hypothetical protein
LKTLLTVKTIAGEAIAATATGVMEKGAVKEKGTIHIILVKVPVRVAKQIDPAVAPEQREAPLLAVPVVVQSARSQ